MGANFGGSANSNWTKQAPIGKGIYRGADGSDTTVPTPAPVPTTPAASISTTPATIVNDIAAPVSNWYQLSAALVLGITIGYLLFNKKAA